MLRPAAAIAASVVLLASHAVLAGPLDPEACNKLKAQLSALDEQGVKALIEKGPEAAKGTVSREQLRQVRQYFDLLGNFRFRCPQDTPLVVLKPAPPEDPADLAAAGAPIDAGTPGITLPAGVAAATVGPVAPSPPRKPPVPKKDPAKTAPATAPATAPQAAGSPQPSQPAPAAKKPPAAPKVAAPAAPAASTQAAPPTSPAATKPKPKPKTDDAFRPPAAAAPAAPATATSAPASSPPAKAP